MIEANGCRDAPREADLCSYLMQDIFTDIKLPEEFLAELAKRFHDDGLIDVIGSTLTGLGDEIAAVKFNENYRSVAIRVTRSKLKSSDGRQCCSLSKSNRLHQSCLISLTGFPLRAILHQELQLNKGPS